MSGSGGKRKSLYASLDTKSPGKPTWREERALPPHTRVKAVNPRPGRAKPPFPDYLFVRRDLKKTGISALQYLPEAAGLIVFGGEAAHAPDGLIQTIRRCVEAGNRTRDK